MIDLFHYPIVRPITGAANLQREIPGDFLYSSIVASVQLLPDASSYPICAGSCCRCNLLTLQGGLLPVRTAGRGVKIGCDILNRPKSVIRKNGKLENTSYCLRDHQRGNDQERRIVVRKRNKRTLLIRQCRRPWAAQLAIGSRKRNDRLNGCQVSRIYSWETYRVYLRHSFDFVRWVKDQYGVRSLEEAKRYAAEYIQVLTAAGYAPSTLKLIAAAVAKTYRCSVDDLGIKTAPRRRADITRSRGRKVSDIHFSEDRNRDLVEFAEDLGSEIERSSRWFVEAS